MTEYARRHAETLAILRPWGKRTPANIFRFCLPSACCLHASIVSYRHNTAVWQVSDNYY